MAGMQNSDRHLQISLLCFVLACISCIKPFSQARSDMITKNQQISYGQTLVSAGGNFVLGFFIPPNSKNHYVGIWYGKVSVQTVVWVANRERPLAGSTGTLVLNDDGDLVIMDWRGGFTVIAYGSASNSNTNTSAKLLDNGNLILIEDNLDNNGRILWQSFDYATDTFLPGMKLGRNLKTKQNHVLTSWKTEEDPSPGVYSFGADPNGTTQFFIWQDGKVYWSSGIFSKNTFTLVPKSGFQYLFNYSYVTNEDEQYFIYSLRNSSIISRFVIHPYGQIKQFAWSEDSKNWSILWTHPRDHCDVYAPCGAFGICNTNSSTLCKCSQGFKPASPRDWESNNWSGGCERGTKLKCGDEIGFLQLKSSKFPDQMQFVSGMAPNIKPCEATCRANCSCTAYAPANKSGCLFWSGELLGLREYFNETYVEQDIFIRIAASELDGRNGTSVDQGKKRKIWVVIIAVTIAFGFLLSGSFIFYFWRRKQIENIKMRQELLQLEIGTNVVASDKFNGKNTFERDVKGSDLRLFSFASIAASTNNFSVENKLGEGGFGPVYKGELLGGQEIGVKRLSRNSGQGMLEFKNEIKLIAKLQHKNLVRLLGCCIHEEEKMLIYEYMPNKSLDSFIFDPTKQRSLDWGKRFRIIEGIAQGLLYLHKYSRLRVIHRDLKASNILLDGEMNPKISDFGMARIFGNNESEANTRRIVGTYGYMSPEYAMKGLFSEKSDVFSFGVILLEIISGKKNTSFDHSYCSLNFLGYAWEMWKDDKIGLLMDPVLGDSVSAHDLKRCINVALLCVQESAVDRPTMLHVVSMLGNEAASLPIPKQPAFFIASSVAEANLLPKNSQEALSANGMSVSLVEPR